MRRSLRVDLTWSRPRSHEEIKKERGRGPPGLYLIIAGKRIAGRWNEGTFRLLDIGQADDVHLRISAHEREDCWHPRARGSSLLVKIAEVPEDENDETDRRALVCCLRVAERPPCGDACREGYHRDESVEISNGGEMAPLKSRYAC